MPVGVLLSESPHALPPQNNRISWGPLGAAGIGDGGGSKHEEML